MPPCDGRDTDVVSNAAATPVPCRSAFGGGSCSRSCDVTAGVDRLPPCCHRRWSGGDTRHCCFSHAGCACGCRATVLRRPRRVLYHYVGNHVPVCRSVLAIRRLPVFHVRDRRSGLVRGSDTPLPRTSSEVSRSQHSGNGGVHERVHGRSRSPQCDMDVPRTSICNLVSAYNVALAAWRTRWHGPGSLSIGVDGQFGPGPGFTRESVKNGDWRW